MNHHYMFTWVRNDIIKMEQSQKRQGNIDEKNFLPFFPWKKYSRERIFQEENLLQEMGGIGRNWNDFRGI